MTRAKQASLDLAVAQPKERRVRLSKVVRKSISLRRPLLIDYQSWVAWTDAVLETPKRRRR